MRWHLLTNRLVTLLDETCAEGSAIVTLLIKNQLTLKKMMFTSGIETIISVCTLSSCPIRTSIPSESESKKNHRYRLPTQAFKSQPSSWTRGALSVAMGQQPHCMKKNMFYCAGPFDEGPDMNPTKLATRQSSSSDSCSEIIGKKSWELKN